VSLQLPAGVYTNLVTTKSLSAPPTILLVDGLNTDAKNAVAGAQKMVRLLASAPSDVPMAVFLLGRNLSLLQSFTTDAKLLRAAAERALTLEATNLQAKDARDDPFSHSSLLEQMAGSGGPERHTGGPPALNQGARAAPEAGTRTRCWRCGRCNSSALRESNTLRSMDIRVKLTLDALRVIARHVSGYPGRKNLIWLSSAFPLAITPDANLTIGPRNSADTQLQRRT